MVTDRLTLRTELQDFETLVPLDAQRLLRSVCRKDGHQRTSRALVPVFTAHESEQTLSVQRSQRLKVLQLRRSV